MSAGPGDFALVEKIRSIHVELVGRSGRVARGSVMVRQDLRGGTQGLQLTGFSTCSVSSLASAR